MFRVAQPALGAAATPAHAVAQPTPSRRTSAEAKATGDGERRLDPGGDEALVVDVVRDAAERAAHRVIRGHRLDQDQRERVQVGGSDSGVRCRSQSTISA